MISKTKLKRLETPACKSRRDRIEAELDAITPMSPGLRKLTSIDGFIDFYLEMQGLYPSQWEAYERLEDYHITITGKRKYSEFSSFRKVMGRRLRKQRNSFAG